MKKLISILVCILALGTMVLGVYAASDKPEIILQPQSPNYPEYSVAIYTVEVTGNNLHATWYLEWLGKTYNISNLGGAMQDWEPFAGESYGPRKLDDNTFAFIFEGIEYDMDGAYIWCVIEDGHYDVTSQKARISVGNPNTPPQILYIPSCVTVEQGMDAEIRCVAQAPENTQLSFLWYETDTGKMEDMRAANRGEETTDYMFLDTSTVGTRYYLCKVETSEGGLAYSSIVTVNVTKPSVMPNPPVFQTQALPNGEVGKPYSAQIACDDPNAEFFIYYNPGGANDFGQTGLVLNGTGVFSGVPHKAGSFTFCVCASNVAGESYMVYTLTVTESSPETTESTEATPGAPSATEATNATSPQQIPRETENQQSAFLGSGDGNAPSGFPWWSLVLIGVLGIGTGLAVALLLTRKK